MSKNVFAGVGISKNDDPFQAGKEAVEMAIKDMKKRGGNEPNFGLVFCSGGKYGKDDRTIKKFVDGCQSVFSKYKGCKWIGGTSSGEISNYGIYRGSVVAMVVSSKYIHVGIGAEEGVHKNAKKATLSSLKSALSDLKVDKRIDAYIRYLVTKEKPLSESMKVKPYLCFVVSAGSTLDTGSSYGDDVLETLTEALGGNIPVFGGCTGDDHFFRKNYQFANGKILKDGIVLMLWVINTKFRGEVFQGFAPRKEYVVVTKAKDYTVSEFNGKPSVDEFKKTLKYEVKVIPHSGFMKNIKIGVAKLVTSLGLPITEKIIYEVLKSPLGFIDKNNNMTILLPIMRVNEKIMFTSKLPEQTLLRRLDCDIDTLKLLERDIYSKIEKSEENIAFFVDLNCSLRGILLGDEFFSKLGNKIKKMNLPPFIGFFSYGEYGFTQDYHNTYNSLVHNILVISDELIVK
ncbi:MAG: hypothetical protein J7K72_01160 [Candidatus Aenigmarchaeota archaeon]|nr:hypothetical protein [Candidatus Aenigmarchaeota archaeon]